MQKPVGWLAGWLTGWLAGPGGAKLWIENGVISLEILIVLNRYIGNVVISFEILIVLNSQTSRKSKILIFR